ncbi:MAG TPA: hypothetical protein VFF73_41215, partial [Planctomycetota bacterium]|nr:hypothetical protein [Planctomycetota bacterium]
MSRRSPKKNEPLSPLGVEISAHVRARFPLLYLVTWEEERALRDLEAVAISLRKMLLVWTETQGLSNVAVPNE